MARPKNIKGGRPLKEVDERLLEDLTMLHLSDKVIAAILQVHVDTLHTRFSEQMDEWRSRSKGKIAEVLFDEGVTKREPWALKALAQKHLDYSDKSEVKGEINITTSLADKMAKARKRIETK